MGLFELNRGFLQVNFIKISADLESQLEIVSEVPREFIQFSPDERPHTLSVVGPLHGIDSRSLIKRRCACAPTS